MIALRFCLQKSKKTMNTVDKRVKSSIIEVNKSLDGKSNAADMRHREPRVC